MGDPTRVVIVTGAAGALGSAIAARLAADAGTALMLCDLSKEGLEVTRESVAATGAPVATAVVDVGDPVAVDEAVAGTVDTFGRLDVMVNNAGIIATNARMHNLTAEDWDRQIRVNLLGVVHGMTSAIKVMRRSGSGSIVNTASVAGLTAWTHSAPYCATKAAVIHLTKAAALEYAKEGIRVNCVCPGAFESGLSAHIPEVAWTAIEARHPAGLGTAADLAGAFAYFAGTESRWTTGAALVVDGGYVLP